LSRAADNHVRAPWTAEGRHEKVIALARLGCEEWPNDHWRVQQLALACEGAGRWKDAASAWESAIAVAKATVPEAERNAVVARYEQRLAAARRTWGFRPR
jgi:hypothetical protein